MTNLKDVYRDTMITIKVLSNVYKANAFEALYISALHRIDEEYANGNISVDSALFLMHRIRNEHSRFLKENNMSLQGGKLIMQTTYIDLFSLEKSGVFIETIIESIVSIKEVRNLLDEAYAHIKELNGQYGEDSIQRSKYIEYKLYNIRIIYLLKQRCEELIKNY